MHKTVSLKYSYFPNNNLWECSNLKPYDLLCLLTDSNSFFLIDQNREKISNIKLDQLEKMLANSNNWRENPDLIIVDNPYCIDSKKISIHDFNILMHIFIDLKFSVNTYLHSIKNTMAFYAHDNMFYATFHSNKLSEDDILCKLLSLAIWNNGDADINICKNAQFYNLKSKLPYGIRLNLADIKFKEKEFTLNTQIYDGSKFSNILFSPCKNENICKFNIEFR